MKEGYLVVKCKRCGCLSHVTISGYRSNWSLCPVCGEGLTERKYEKPSIRTVNIGIKQLQELQPHELDNLKLSYN